MPPLTRVCRKCGKNLPLGQFVKHPTCRYGRTHDCRSCHSKVMMSYLSDPRERMLRSSRTTANLKGLEHTIGLADISLPVTCKYLGIRLDYRRAGEKGRHRSQDAPSIDRIDSTRGYVPGNVQVISDLANRMKQDATPAQLLAFAAGVLRIHGPAPDPRSAPTSLSPSSPQPDPGLPADPTRPTDAPVPPRFPRVQRRLSP